MKVRFFLLIPALLVFSFSSLFSQQQFFEESVAFGLDESFPEGASLSWCDFDLDGDLDIYAALQGESNRLYQNLGEKNNYKFKQVAADLFVNDDENSCHAAWGDFNNDGYPDLYVTNDAGSNHLFKNSGKAQNFIFQDISIEHGVDDAGNGRHCIWGDYNNDGYLDLYVVNDAGSNLLYKNLGLENNFLFQENAQILGVDDDGNGRSAQWIDYNDDGYLDLYVVNFGGKNRMFRNRGKANGYSFEDVSDMLGIADQGSGQDAAWVDYDNDGDLDLYLANEAEPNRLFQNSGVDNNYTFEDVAPKTGVDDGGNSTNVSWGDYDNDGDADLYVAGEGQNRLFNNLGATNGFSFMDVASDKGVGGDGLTTGLTWVDVNNDGNLDLFLTNDGLLNRFYRNKGSGLNYIIILTAGAGCNLYQVRRVTIKTASGTQTGQVYGGFEAPKHFGLGQDNTIDQIEISAGAGEFQDQLFGVNVNTTVILDKVKILKPLWLKANKTTATSGDSIVLSGQMLAINIKKSFVDSLYLSLDQKLDSNDAGLDSMITIPKSVGYIFNTLQEAMDAITYDFNKTVRITDSATNRYWFMLSVDAIDQISECSENNNTIASMSSIDITQSKADLTGAMSSSLPSSIAIGENMTLSCNIHNNGGEPVTTDFKTSFYISNDKVFGSDTLLQSVNITNDIDPFTSITRNISAPFPLVSSGYHYLIAQVDSGNVIVETNETNNTFSRWDSTDVNAIKIGNLIIKTDNIRPIRIDSTVISGNTFINKYLKLSGTFDIDFTDSTLYSHNCALSVDSLTIPGWIPTELVNNDEITIYTGDIEMDLGTGQARIDFDPPMKLPFQLGLFDLQLKTIGISENVIILGFDIIFPNEIGGSVEIDSFKMVRGDGVELAGKIYFPTPIGLKGISIDSAWVQFHTEPNNYSGGGIAGVPNIADISFEIYLSNGMIDSLKITYTPDQTIPINSTGISIKEVGGEIKNIRNTNNNPLTVILSAALVAGPKIDDFYVVEADPITVNIKPNFFEAEASSIEVFKQQTGQAKLIYNNGTKTVTCSTTVNFINVLKGDLNASANGFSLNRPPSFNGSIQGNLELPAVDKFPFDYISDFVGLPKTLGGIYATAHNDRAQGTFYLTLMPSYRKCIRKCWWSPWSGWHRCCFTVPALNFNGAFRFIYKGGSDLDFYAGENYQSLTKIFALTKEKASSLAPFAFQKTVTVPPNKPQVIFRLSGAPGSPPPFDLLSPYGFNVTPEDTFALADNLMLLHYWTQPERGYSYYLVHEPWGGDWIVQSDVENVELDVFCQNNPPVIKMLGLEGGENMVHIKWLDSDVDDDAKIRFYYDTDNRGLNGSPIPLETDIFEDDKENTFIWYPEAVPTGEYYVYATIEDSVNAPAFSYSPSPVKIVQQGTPSIPTGFSATSKDTMLHVMWKKNPDAHILGYTVHYSDNFDSKEYQHSRATGDTTALDLVVAPGRKYRLALTAFNRWGFISDYSSEIVVDFRNLIGNNWPFITSLPVRRAVEGSTLLYQVLARDIDGDGLTFSLNQAPANMTISPTGLVEWVADSLGVHKVEIEVNDGRGGKDVQAFTLNVSSPNFSDGRIYLDSRFYDANLNIGLITVNDLNKDKNAQKLEEILVRLVSTSDTSGIIVKCLETAAASGSFVGSFGFSSGSASDEANGLISVSENDTIRVFYYDSEYATGDFYPKWDVAIWQPKPVDVDENIDESNHIFKKYELFQNWPNPFNASTTIKFHLPEKTFVNLIVYNLNGQKTKTLYDKELKAGVHTILWDGKNDSGEHVASGLYFYRIETENFVSLKRMILVR